MSVSPGRPAERRRPRAVVPQRSAQAVAGGSVPVAPYGSGLVAPGRRIGGSWYASCRRCVASAN